LYIDIDILFYIKVSNQKKIRNFFRTYISIFVTITILYLLLFKR